MQPRLRVPYPASDGDLSDGRASSDGRVALYPSGLLLAARRRCSGPLDRWFVPWTDIQGAEDGSYHVPSRYGNADIPAVWLVLTSPRVPLVLWAIYTGVEVPVDTLVAREHHILVAAPGRRLISWSEWKATFKWISGALRGALAQTPGDQRSALEELENVIAYLESLPSDTDVSCRGTTVLSKVVAARWELAHGRSRRAMGLVRSALGYLER